MGYFGSLEMRSSFTDCTITDGHIRACDMITRQSRFAVGVRFSKSQILFGLAASHVCAGCISAVSTRRYRHRQRNVFEAIKPLRISNAMSLVELNADVSTKPDCIDWRDDISIACPTSSPLRSLCETIKPHQSMIMPDNLHLHPLEKLPAPSRTV